METLRFLLTSTFYPPHHIGGDAVHVKYLAEELVKRGHEVHVLHSLDAYWVKRKHHPEKAEADGLYTYSVKTSFNSTAYEAYVWGYSPAVLKTFRSLVKQVKPDVVHHHNISLLGYGILKKQAEYINLYTAHDYWLVCQQNNLLKYGSRICEGGSCLLCNLRHGRPPQIWRYSKRFKEVVEGNIDCFIAPSNFLKEKILEKFRVKAITLPNFVPEPPDQLEPSGYSNYFLYAGVLEKHKGIENLVSAYREIAYEIDTKLIIVGEGSLKAWISNFIRSHGLGQKIILLGWMENTQLQRLLKDARALVIPSTWHENCPLIALEALSMGTPVIASNKGGLPEIVGKIDKDLVCNSTDKLKQTLINLSKAKYHSQIVKRTYEENYSPKTYFARFFELIRQQV